MAGTIIESDSYDTKHKLQLLLGTVFRSLPDNKGEIRHVLANISVTVNADVRPIVRSRLTKWTSTLKPQIFQVSYSSFSGTLQTSSSSPMRGLKNAMFKKVEQVLGVVKHSGRSHTVSEADIQSFVQTELLADTIVQSVLFCSGLEVPIAIVEDKIVDGAVDKLCLRHVKGESKTTAALHLLSTARCTA